MYVHGVDSIILLIKWTVWTGVANYTSDIPQSSIDHQMKTYTFIGVHIHKYIKHRGHHWYQNIYFGCLCPCISKLEWW